MEKNPMEKLAETINHSIIISVLSGYSLLEVQSFSREKFRHYEKALVLNRLKLQYN